MTFVDAAGFPPEVNYTLLTTGDLGASLTGAGMAHQSLADMLIAEMLQMGFNTSSTAAVSWQGPGGQMMQISAGEFITILEAASMWIQTASEQALEVVAAHQAAVQAMIPAEVSLTNRATQGTLVATNFMGFHTPAINVLDAQYGSFWINNAGQRSVFGAVVSMALGLLATPAPMSPNSPNPAGPAMGVATAAGQAGIQGGLQAAGQTMTTAAEAPVAGGSAASSTGQNMMGSVLGTFGSMAGQAGSVVQPMTSVAGMFPQLASQAPSLFSSMLGPLSSSSGLGGVEAAGLGPSVAAAPALAGALAGGGGAGGGGLLSAGGMASSFVRPASSFAEPAAPKLPGGWQGGGGGGTAAEPVAAQPSGVGGGGLYGAPAAMGREGGTSTLEKMPPRTMQVTARSAANRGEQQRN